MNKNLQADQNICMKIDKSNFGWLFACVGLVLLLVLSVFLGKSGFLFKTENAFTTDLVLGQNIECGLNKNQATSVSLNFSGGFLPGERLPQVVAVKNAEDQSLLYLRAKVFVYTSQNQMLEVDVVENSNWVKNEDGYFYYNDLIKPNEKVNFCSHIIVGGENFQPVSWKKYILSFVFETLDNTLDSQTIWGWQLVQND